MTPQSSPESLSPRFTGSVSAQKEAGREALVSGELGPGPDGTMGGHPGAQSHGQMTVVTPMCAAVSWHCWHVFVVDTASSLNMCVGWAVSPGC